LEAALQFQNASISVVALSLDKRSERSAR